LSEGELLVEAHGSRIGSDFGALIEPGRAGTQVPVFERFEMSLWNLGFTSNALERQPATFASVSEQLPETNASVYA
jgi:hypothetical protein